MIFAGAALDGAAIADDRGGGAVVLLVALLRGFGLRGATRLALAGRFLEGLFFAARFFAVRFFAIRFFGIWGVLMVVEAAKNVPRRPAPH